MATTLTFELRRADGTPADPPSLTCGCRELRSLFSSGSRRAFLVSRARANTKSHPIWQERVGLTCAALS
jgi:hypothetical protein